MTEERIEPPSRDSSAGETRTVERSESTERTEKTETGADADTEEGGG